MVNEAVTEIGALAIIIANVIIVLQNRRQTRKVNTVQRTLTENNGGDHVKDQLDRMEDHLERMDMRGDRQERALLSLENKFNRHLLWSNERNDHYNDRLSAVEKRKEDGQS